MEDTKQTYETFMELQIAGTIDAVEDIRLCDTESREDRQPHVVVALRTGEDRLAMVIEADNALALGQDLITYAMRAQMEGKFHSFLHTFHESDYDPDEAMREFRIWNHHDSIKRGEACNTVTE